MAHVSPHLWADAARGRLTGSQTRTIEEHAGSCTRCAAERERVLGAVEAFRDIRTAEPPRLGWDHIGARIYWAVSSERRHGTRQGRKAVLRAGRPWLMAAAAAAAIAAVWITAGGQSRVSGDAPALATPSKAQDAASDRELSPAPPEPPALTSSAPLQGLVTFLQGEVTADGEPLDFDALLAEGTRITTGAGKVTVQFDNASGFTVAENTSVVLTAFDEREVVLALAGEVVVDITRRRPEQSFVVVAGEREVHVRGTSFRVEHRGERLRVACGHGEVAVIGAADEVAVGPGQVVQFAGDKIHAGTLDLSQIAGIQREVVRVPAWSGAAAMRQTSATLHIAASAKRPVDIDGVTVGAGSFFIRLLSGRHHISADDVPGTWVELEPGKSFKAPVRAPRRSEPAAGGDTRRRELLAALEQGTRLDGCTRTLRKLGVLQGAFILLDLGVLRDGTIEYLNIADTNLPRATARCVRDAVDGIAFPPGPAASFRQRIAW